MYLPQFHPIIENDINWGKGFTEWRNVVKGKQIVKGQYQPHYPSELGFYDLRVPEVRKEQAALAKEHGIYGFCYYHYWFNGKLLLERPINEIIATKEPDFPFCVCWANENWTKAWDGNTKNVLLHQNYSAEDNLQHIRYLCENIFQDKRYITIDNKPVIVIYKPGLIPDVDKMAIQWKEEAKKYGFDGLYMIFFQLAKDKFNADDLKFDASAQFAPFGMKHVRDNKTLLDRVIAKLGMGFTTNQKYRIFEYEKIANDLTNQILQNTGFEYPSITPMWDNYVRRQAGGAEIFVNSTPDRYQHWLDRICQNWEPRTADENFVFINAWNEWAEGNHLEPCERWGRQYLEATKNVLDKYL